MKQRSETFPEYQLRLLKEVERESIKLNTCTDIEEQTKILTSIKSLKDTIKDKICISDKIYNLQKDIAYTIDYNQFEIGKKLFGVIFKEVTAALNTAGMEWNDTIIPDGISEEQRSELILKREKVEQLMSKLLIDKLMEWNKDHEVLALFYLDENEKEFNYESYLERITIFKKIPMILYGMLGDVFHDFFMLSLKYFKANSLTYFKEM